VSGATLIDRAAWAASTTFSSTGLKSGYDKQEVDAFRSAVRDTFLGGAAFWVNTPLVRSDDLRGKFSTHRPGYDKTRVAAFLEAACLRLAAIESTDCPVGPLVSSAILGPSGPTRRHSQKVATPRRRWTPSRGLFATRSAGKQTQ
jgi:hypothetical protein